MYTYKPQESTLSFLLSFTVLPLDFEIVGPKQPLYLNFISNGRQL